MQNHKYELTKLPFDYDSLSPVISKEILQLHHDKHHAGYVIGANSALALLEKARAKEITISRKAIMRDLSFNLNGHLLHELYWLNMKPFQNDNSCNDEMLNIIKDNFGSYEAFTDEFREASITVEGSGWSVLGKDSERRLAVFQIEKHNFLNLIGFTPILVNDLWEHAYYLDYKNDRGAYVDEWWKVVNWEEVLKRYNS